MVEIKLENIGKKFSNRWLFKNINLSFVSNKIYAITGQNGSGKSTFLSIISGYTSASVGYIQYCINNKKIAFEEVSCLLSISAPYLETIEEFTLDELIDFHFSFNTFIEGKNKQSFFVFTQLNSFKNKLVSTFSSGMKQRLKLGLAVYSNKPILLLDEPTVNLDINGIAWYKNQVVPLFNERLVIICSNQKYEYDFVDNIIDLECFKSYI